MKILYGTTNRAKLESMRERLAALGIVLAGPGELGRPLPAIEESGRDPLENAVIKAKAYYEAYRMPVFSCDSGLYFEGLESSLQPGTHVRRVGGRELSDEEMIAYYSALARAHQDRLVGRYRNAICFVADRGQVFQSMDESLATPPFRLVSTPHREYMEGFPLDALSVDLETGRYFVDLPGHRVDRPTVESGFTAFFCACLAKLRGETGPQP